MIRIGVYFRGMSLSKKKSEQILFFTQRESQCLHYVVECKTLAQMAESLKVQESSVSFYLNSISKKLALLSTQKNRLNEDVHNAEIHQ